MRRVSARRHISDGDQRTKGVVIQRVGGKEVLVLVVTGRSPKVPNLLGTDLRVDRVRWALQRRGRHLQDRQGRSIVAERLGDTYSPVSVHQCAALSEKSYQGCWESEVEAKERLPCLQATRSEGCSKALW